jgi:hypothetical protein
MAVHPICADFMETFFQTFGLSLEACATSTHEGSSLRWSEQEKTKTRTYVADIDIFVVYNSDADSSCVSPWASRLNAL